MSAIVTVHDTPAPPASGVKALGIVPPHDMDAEAAVISAVLLDTSALVKIGDFLRGEHFYSEAHRRIYEAAVAIGAEGKTIDSVTVGARLKETKRLAQVGGLPYIASILDATPAPANVRAHAEIIFERWRVRQVMLLCEQAGAYGHGVVDAQKYADSVIHALAVVARNRPGEKPEGNFEVLRRIARTSYEMARGTTEKVGKSPALLTGIRAYDDHLGGLYAGQKTTLVALPRVGKTALALQIAINVAKLGVAVAFFSTEMDHEELGDRQLAQLARIDSKRIRLSRQKPILEDAEWTRLTMAVNDESNTFKLHVFDDGSPTVDDICARAKNLAEQSLAVDGVPLGLVVVDYVQRLTPAPSVSNRSKPEQITYSTKRLKHLAKELKLPVLELAQQKVLEKDRSGKRAAPTLGDAQWCSNIEQESHNVLYLYRPSERDGSDVRLACVKQRGGEEFEESLLFERAYSRFTDAGPGVAISRQYVDHEPPPGRFDDDDNNNFFSEENR